MRKTRKGKLRRQKIIIVIGSFCMLLFFSVGYAAFSTTIRLNAKGNVKSNRLILNSNGGILDVTSKRVTKGKAYGELPTPTREGYIFKGWNGKNIINMEDHNVTITNYYYKDEIPTPKYVLKPSTNYVLTFDYKVNSSTKNLIATVGYGATGFSRDIRSSSVYSGTNRLELNFTTPATFDYNPPYIAFRFVRMSSPGDANVDISNIQLEEGTEATDYEPYYVTSDTLVTQEGEHTLTAIWEEEPTEE